MRERSQESYFTMEYHMKGFCVQLVWGSRPNIDCWEIGTYMGSARGKDCR